MNAITLCLTLIKTFLGEDLCLMLNCTGAHIQKQIWGGGGVLGPTFVVFVFDKKNHYSLHVTEICVYFVLNSIKNSIKLVYFGVI